LNERIQSERRREAALGTAELSVRADETRRALPSNTRRAGSPVGVRDRQSEPLRELAEEVRALVFVLSFDPRGREEKHVARRERVDGIGFEEVAVEADRDGDGDARDREYGRR
jgi:hypothetical protein